MVNEYVRRHRLQVLSLVVVAVLVFGLVLGTMMVGTSGGTGDLVVNVVDQHGNAVSGETVEIERGGYGLVFSDTTNQNGTVVAENLQYDSYAVNVDGQTENVQFNPATNTVEIQITASPPEPDGSPSFYTDSISIPKDLST